MRLREMLFLHIASGLAVAIPRPPALESGARVACWGDISSFNAASHLSPHYRKCTHGKGGQVLSNEEMESSFFGFHSFGHGSQNDCFWGEVASRREANGTLNRP